MKLSGVIFCNSCSLAIPEGEETNPFRVAFLDKEGHCHGYGECLRVRNEVVSEYDAMIQSWIKRLHPQIETANRAFYARQISAKHPDLKRAPSEDPTKVLKKVRAPRPKKAKKRAA
jgi:hypothetical protein